MTVEPAGGEGDWGGALRAEVERRFGVPPNSSGSPSDNPEIAAALQGFATFVYLDNPLPPLFKERLFVSLSRFCDVRYRIARHVGFLIGLGTPSGDAASPVESAAEVIRLVRRPFPRGADLGSLRGRLLDGGKLAELPGPGSPDEEAVFACASHIFLGTPDLEGCLDALCRSLGEARLQSVLNFLAFVRTAHFWSQVQNGRRLEDDIEYLLAINERLAEALALDPDAWDRQLGRSLDEELVTPRGEGAGAEQRRREERRALDLTRAELVERVTELRAARRAALNVMEDAVEARDALRESEGRLQLALSAARMGIWTWDVTTDMHTRDANLNRLLGQEPVESRQPFGDFLARSIHPDDRERVEATFRDSASRGRPLNVEFRIVLSDGRVRWLRDQGDIFGDAEDSSGHMSGVCLDVTSLKEAEGALRLARDELERRVAERTSELEATNAALQEAAAARADLLRRAVSMQEDERRRISRELHDRLGQELTALILSLKALERVVPPDSPGRGRLIQAEAIVDRLGRESHDLAIELRPTALDDIGLGPALATYVARWSERTGIAADFRSPGLDGERLPPDVETAVYRVVQEALNNVVKHAAARHVSVIVERHGGELTALVEDDGRGFDLSPLDRSGHGSRSLGVLGMRERVALLGGSFLIESGGGEGKFGGTIVRIRVPLQGPPEGHHG
ncbi:sensor histidine kinase [Aquisphaera insulae]|uniref:sensor histidine kinase n=1 Tax=Aquisphaera insulae TaxID=2712864 RepID=UPI0013EC36CE|nr:sensor histidine kinase [Aquisphaera insulae]